jgi:hypothetical protein
MFSMHPRIESISSTLNLTYDPLDMLLKDGENGAGKLASLEMGCKWISTTVDRPFVQFPGGFN